IRDEATARESCVAVVEEEEQPVDVDPTDRRRLRDRIEVIRVGAEGVLRRRGRIGGRLWWQLDVESEIRYRPPEVVESGAASEALVEGHDRPIDDHVVRAEPEAGDARVVADLEDERVRRRAICARLEEKRRTVAPKLVVHLDARHRIERRLDPSLRHGRTEDMDVGSEIRWPR